MPQLFEQLRVDHGTDIELLHDAHHRLTPIEAARLARDLEPYRLFWLEDATPAENQQAFEIIRRHSVTPLAVGEVFNSIWDCKHLIEKQLIDYIRTTIVHAGGITHVRRLADFAALHQVRTGFHGATDLSPVCMGAALHFDAWVPNFGIQEWMHHSKQTDEVFPHDYFFRDGRLYCGEGPGHGVSIDEKLAAKFPYSPKQLPIARLDRRFDVGLVMVRVNRSAWPVLSLMLSASTAWCEPIVIPLVRIHRPRCGVRADTAGRPLSQSDPRGFYPDPSITRAGDKFYLVNSTFAYFPGIPVFESSDLVHWTQIGSVIDRPSQLDFGTLGVSRGVFAPSIEYHDGMFYVFNTHVDRGGNYVVTAKDPAGPWSDPVWLPPLVDGIDPSMFIDEDGHAYVLNNGPPEGAPRYRGHRAIWIQQFDRTTLAAARAAQDPGRWRRRSFEAADLDRRPTHI